MQSDLTPFVIGIVAVAAVMLLAALFVARKGRPFAAGDVFRASRLSAGNRLFPTQVQITPTSVVHYTPRWIGHREESIHIAHVASVSIETHLMFSDVFVETSGGAKPVRCHGHRKRDAVRMKALIEEYQSGYYKQPPAAPNPAVAPPPSGR
jgi:hypothetical protein